MGRSSSPKFMGIAPLLATKVTQKYDTTIKISEEKRVVEKPLHTAVYLCKT